MTGFRFGTPTVDQHLCSYASCSGAAPTSSSFTCPECGRTRSVVVHHSSRNEDSVFGTACISRSCRRPYPNSDMRQLDGHGVCHLAMGQGLLCPMLVGLPSSEMDGGSRREVSSRSVPCPGRFPQPSRACCRDRVVSSPSGGEFTTSRVGQPMNLPLYCSLVPEPQTNFEDAFRHPCFGWVSTMRSQFEGRDCFMSQFSIVTKTHLSFTWFRAFAMGSPFSGRVCVGNFCTRSERSLYLNHIPRSFRMGSPFVSGVVLGPHLITNEGFSWKLARVPSGWGHPVRVKLCTTCSRLKEYLG